VDRRQHPEGDLNGVVVPRITAATNYQVFIDTFDAPGVEYVAIPYDPDQQTVMTNFGLTGGCAKNETQPYNDGAFVGLHGIWTQCGPTQLAEWHQLVVSPPNNATTLVLQIQITSATELPVLQNILDSFNTGSGTAPVPTAPVPTAPVPTAAVPTAPLPTVPLATVPLPTVPLATGPVPTAPLPTTPTVQTAPLPTAPVPTAPVPTVAGSAPAVPAGFVPLVDDTQSITIAVPNTWLDIDTSPFVGDQGGQAPRIEAATNIQSFNDTFDAPGALLIELPFDAASEAFVNENGLDAGLCASTVTEPFTNGRFTGHVGRFTGCGSTGTAEWHIMLVSPADQSASYLLIVQITSPAELPVLTTVANSFGPVGQGGAVVPTGVPVPPTTIALATIPTPATAPGG